MRRGITNETNEQMEATNVNIPSVLGVPSWILPATCANTAAIESWINDSNPEAVPASSGRTLTAPALALGSDIPFATPINVTGMNTVQMFQ